MNQSPYRSSSLFKSPSRGCRHRHLLRPAGIALITALVMAVAPLTATADARRVPDRDTMQRRQQSPHAGSHHGNDHGHGGRGRGPHRPDDDDKSPLPTFTRTWEYNGQTYTSRFVGADPRRGPSTTHVKALIVPLRLQFADGTARDATTDVFFGRTVLDWILHSPFFQTSHFSSKEVDQGDTQFGDALMRLNFWTEGGSNPNYHLIMDPVVQPLVTLDVPADKVDFTAGSIDANWLIQQQTAILEAMNPDPAAVVVLVMSHDLYFSNGAGSWHGAQKLASRPNGPEQTYILVEAYAVNGAPDAYTGTTFGHEVSEWLTDPFIDNEVPPWTRTITYDGVVHDDSYNLDVLESGDAFESNWDNYFLWTTDEGIDFVMQDNANFDYFTRRSKSRSFGGWYSFNGATSPSVSSFDEKLFDVQTFRVPGALLTYLNGINDQGDMVGYYYVSGETTYRGMSVVNGQVRNLSFPGATNTIPTAINHNGRITGYYWGTSGPARSFVWDHGNFQAIDPLPGGTSIPIAFNDAGDIGGAFFPTGATASPFTLGLYVRNGHAQTILPPGATDAQILGLSRSGVLTGSYTTLGDGAIDTGFFGRPGHFETVTYAGPGPAALFTWPSLMTDSGILGGTYEDTESNQNGFYLIDGAWSRVGCGHNTSLNGMNERGVAVGTVDGMGAVTTHGIIVTPRRRH